MGVYLGLGISARNHIPKIVAATTDQLRQIVHGDCALYMWWVTRGMGAESVSWGVGGGGEMVRLWRTNGAFLWGIKVSRVAGGVFSAHWFNKSTKLP